MIILNDKNRDFVQDPRGGSWTLGAGQQGVHPLPARLWRIRLADMEPLGFVFLQLSSFTDPSQIPVPETELGLPRALVSCPKSGYDLLLIILSLKPSSINVDLPPINHHH